jgi:hypothetical protein
VRSINLTVHIRTISWHGGRASFVIIQYYFFGFHEDNLFYRDLRHTRATIPLRPPTRAIEGAWDPGQASRGREGCLTQAVVVRQSRLSLVTQAFLSFHTRLLRHHHPYQTFSDESRSSGGSHAPGTLPARIENRGASELSGYASAWALSLPRCNT